MSSAMSDDKEALEEAKRVMARLVRMPPKPHKSSSAAKEGDKPKRGRPKKG